MNCHSNYQGICKWRSQKKRLRTNPGLTSTWSNVVVTVLCAFHWNHSETSTDRTLTGRLLGKEAGRDFNAQLCSWNFFAIDKAHLIAEAVDGETKVLLLKDKQKKDKENFKLQEADLSILLNQMSFVSLKSVGSAPENILKWLFGGGTKCHTRQTGNQEG